MNYILTPRPQTMKKTFRTILLLFFTSMLVLSGISFAQESIKGVVVNVFDAQTVTVWEKGKLYKIRLYGIDTPGEKQNFGGKAKKFTSDWVFNKDLIVIPEYTDKDGTIVGIIYINSNCLNQEILKKGYAWVSRKNCNKPVCKKWLGFERFAKKNKTGLWIDTTWIPSSGE